MAKMMRANVILHVKDSQVQRYLDSGYTLVDENTGAVLATPSPTDIGTLRKYYVEHTTRIKELEAENEKLRGELESLKAEPKKKASKKSETESE